MTTTSPLPPLIARLFPARALPETGEAWVRVSGEIATANLVTSPLTGHRAAAFRYVLARTRTIHAEGGSRLRHTPITSGYFGESLLVRVEGRLIRLELADTRFRGASDPDDFTLVHRLPPSLVDAVESSSTWGSVSFRETALWCGDAVRITGLARALGAPGGYREAASISPHEFEIAANPRPRLEDRSIA